MVFLRAVGHDRWPGLGLGLLNHRDRMRWKHEGKEGGGGGGGVSTKMREGSSREGEGELRAESTSTKQASFQCCLLVQSCSRVVFRNFGRRVARLLLVLSSAFFEI